MKDEVKIVLVSLLLIGLIGLACGDWNSEPNIVEYKSPEIKVEGTKITVTAYVQNIGGNMAHDYILELQPREPGFLPLSVWIGPQQACDASHPENVHRGFLLATGEKATIVLESHPAIGTTYDLYLLGRSKCYSEYPTGNEIIGPWGQWTKIGTVETGNSPPSDCDYCLTPGEKQDCRCNTDVYNGIPRTFVECRVCNWDHCLDQTRRVIEYCDNELGCNNGKCAATTTLDNGGGGGGDESDYTLWIIGGAILVFIMISGGKKK